MRGVFRDAQGGEREETHGRSEPAGVWVCARQKVDPTPWLCPEQAGARARLWGCTAAAGWPGLAAIRVTDAHTGPAWGSKHRVSEGLVLASHID